MGRRRAGTRRAGTALVGNPQQVAERIREYQALGITNFIFSGYPHLEEAHRFAELVMPLLPLASNAQPKRAALIPGRLVKPSAAISAR